jgi:cobalamin biosynthesis Mg chelatase CobN
MRFSAYLSIGLAAVVLLALPAVAAAQPKPILKPPDAPAKTTTHTTTVTPKAPPVTPTHTSTGSRSTGSTSTGSTSTGSTSTGSTTGSTGTQTPGTGTNTTTPPLTETPVVILGGRDHANDFVAAVHATVTPPPSPTPLTLVAVGDRLPTSSTSTPAWKLALLALLAAAEAFLVVRLVRNRPGVLSPAS